MLTHFAFERHQSAAVRLRRSSIESLLASSIYERSKPPMNDFFRTTVICQDLGDGSEGVIIDLSPEVLRH